MRLIAVLAIVITSSGCGSEDPQVARGRELAADLGCVSCHTADGGKGVGPTWQGLYGSKVELSDSSVVLADEDYLTESIKQPSAKTVKGFPAGTMERVIAPGSVDDDEIAALIAYIKSLR